MYTIIVHTYTSTAFHFIFHPASPAMGWDRMGWDGMGWDGSCRRGSGAGSLGLKMVARLAAAGGGGWDRGSSAFDHPR